VSQVKCTGISQSELVVIGLLLNGTLASISPLALSSFQFPVSSYHRITKTKGKNQIRIVIKISVCCLGEQKPMHCLFADVPKYFTVFI